jgi:hypothetical protein
MKWEIRKTHHRDHGECFTAHYQVEVTKGWFKKVRLISVSLIGKLAKTTT